MFSPPSGWDYKSVLPCPAFYMDPEGPTAILRLAGPAHSYPLKPSLADWLAVGDHCRFCCLPEAKASIFHPSFAGPRKPQHLQGEAVPALVRLRSVEINHRTY